MKNYYFVVKVTITTLVVCLLQISTTAQLRTPENVPITFYGKVIDQNNQPLEGAKVSLLVVISHVEQLDTEQKPLAVVTDKNGDFTVTGFIANAIDAVSVTKEGYKLSTKAERTFVFGDIPTYIPDPNNPVVFRMWKEGQKEPLITGSKTYKIIPDGEPFTIDLLKHQERPGISPPGDIVVRISRPKKLFPRRKFDWSYSIEAVDGGIVNTNADFLYLAPETGYLPKYEFAAFATNARWFGWARDQFYLKSRGGRVFGSLEVEVTTDNDDHAAIQVNSALNPSGSRHLER